MISLQDKQKDENNIIHPMRHKFNRFNCPDLSQLRGRTGSEPTRRLIKSLPEAASSEREENITRDIRHRPRPSWWSGGDCE
jgi:hypothetical protein